MRRENDDRDAGGEAGGHGIGNELDDGAEAAEAHQYDDDAGHDGGGGQAGVSVPRGNAVDDDDKRAGGAADLHAAAAQQRDQKTGDDCGVQAHRRRRDSGGIDDAFGNRGDAEGHGQRQGDHTHGDAGEEVAEKLSTG